MTEDPRIPFYLIEEQARADIDKMLARLTDAQLTEVYDLFHASNHSSIPFRYWGVAVRVRVHIRREQKKRQEAAPND